MRLHPARPRRHGVAAVEFAIVLPIFMFLLMGTWEIARLVQVYQVLCSAAREGARIAAQGQIINLTGSYTQIQTDTGTPNVTDAVKNCLSGAGISTTGVTVIFTFLDSSGNAVSSPTQPYQGTKGQRFQVSVSLPYTSFRLNSLNYFNITNVYTAVDWTCLRDDAFTLDTSLPTWNPLP